MSQGEIPDFVQYIREGSVLVTSVSSSGEETICSVRGAGSLLGLELLQRKVTDYQAWALSEVVLCMLNAEAFGEWLGNLQSPMGAVLGMALAESSRRRDERVALVGRTVSRVARFLLERRRLDPEDRPLGIQRQILARMLGMRAETFSRALARLQAAGAIAKGREVQVLDAQKLVQFTGDDG